MSCFPFGKRGTVGEGIPRLEAENSASDKTQSPYETKMKNGNPCPKCGHTEIARVPNQWTDHADTIHVGFMGMANVRLDRYICLGCGFNEDWVDCAEGIDRLRDYRVR
jgi:predicted RNA-binding Zn-ribbon protein involved in translation (DUF1610 family)